LTSTIEKRMSLHQRLAQQEQENAELRAQNMQLQALANLGSATCMIAHEINNLLTPLASYAALAAQNPADRDLMDKVLHKTVGNCRRASEIMDSMLAMANGQSQQRDNANLKALVEEIFTCLCRDFAKDGIAVDVQVAEDLALPCIAVQIQQVLMNLILNARDAMLPGGGVLRVAASRNGQGLRIEVSDTGEGIAPEDVKNVFRPFFTTKPPRNGGVPGSGVGLAFCRRIVQAHHGQIDVESERGKGSTFRIQLPMT
jgi:two-component system NtrC family sensor kinase